MKLDAVQGPSQQRSQHLAEGRQRTCAAARRSDAPQLTPPLHTPPLLTHPPPCLPAHSLPWQGPGLLMLAILGWVASKVLDDPPEWLKGLVAGERGCSAACRGWVGV